MKKESNCVYASVFFVWLVSFMQRAVLWIEKKRQLTAYTVNWRYVIYAPEMIRTSGLQFRKLLLYPAELRAHGKDYDSTKPYMAQPLSGKI